MPNVLDVAAYLINKVNEAEWDDITNLKLQKILYYCQGFSLAILDRPLFSNPIEAWRHGPVIREVYDTYKQYNGNVIDKVSAGDSDALSSKEKELVDDVYSVYGRYSAWHLRNLTHSEPTWAEAYQEGLDIEITHDAMKEYFSKQIEEI